MSFFYKSKNLAKPFWAGGILDTKKIADYAEVYKVYLAAHNSGGTVCIANFTITSAFEKK